MAQKRERTIGPEPKTEPEPEVKEAKYRSPSPKPGEIIEKGKLEPEEVKSEPKAKKKNAGRKTKSRRAGST